MKVRFIIALLAFTIAGLAQAEQGCPPGQIPAQAGGNVTSCGPIPAGYYQQQQQAAPTPSGEWIKTWGAVSVGAIDSTTSYGVTAGKLSKEDAEQDSLKRCASHGEDNCKVAFTYYNQCVAIAEPQINGLPLSSGSIRFVSAPTVSKASSESSKKCAEFNKKTSGVKCKVVYTACTEPIFRSY
jgi:hypothetical protein